MANYDFNSDKKTDIQDIGVVIRVYKAIILTEDGGDPIIGKAFVDLLSAMYHQIYPDAPDIPSAD